MPVESSTEDKGTAKHVVVDYLSACLSVALNLCVNLLSHTFCGLVGPSTAVRAGHACTVSRGAASDTEEEFAAASTTAITALLLAPGAASDTEEEFAAASPAAAGALKLAPGAARPTEEEIAAGLQDASTARFSVVFQTAAVSTMGDAAPMRDATRARGEKLDSA